jgi:site-specific DNA-methyltransferase (adenine-specific)
MPSSIVYNEDCIEVMKRFDDNYFDLAICDPPYGISSNPSRHGGTGAGKLKNRVLNQSASKFKDWDIKPSSEYFEQLFRVSKNQIIWGGELL